MDRLLTIIERLILVCVWIFALAIIAFGILGGITDNAWGFAFIPIGFIVGGILHSTVKWIFSR